MLLIPSIMMMCSITQCQDEWGCLFSWLSLLFPCWRTQGSVQAQGLRWATTEKSGACLISLTHFFHLGAAPAVAHATQSQDWIACLTWGSSEQMRGSVALAGPASPHWEANLELSQVLDTSLSFYWPCPSLVPLCFQPYSQLKPNPAPTGPLPHGQETSSGSLATDPSPRWKLLWSLLTGASTCF